MEVPVWDTDVQRKDRRRMHFDILVTSDITDERTVFNHGPDYLKTKAVGNHGPSTAECRFCHIEGRSEDLTATMHRNGYAIIEMENCE